MIKPLLFVFMITLNIDAWATDIEVLHNDQIVPGPYFAKGYESEIYNVDDFTRLLAEMSQGLPRSEALAVAMVESRMKIKREDIQRAAASRALLKRYALEKLPAIVFNGGTHVYYGTNIKAAIELYENAK